MKKTLLALTMLFVAVIVRGETLLPSTDGDETTWQIVGYDTTNWQAVNNEGIGIDHAGTWYRDLYQLSNTSLTNITSVTLKITYVGNGQLAFSLKSGDTVVDVSTSTLTWDLEFHDVTTTLTQSPFTGSAWTASEINSLQAGLKGNTASPLIICNVYEVTVEGSTSAAYKEIIKGRVQFKMGATVR